MSEPIIDNEFENHCGHMVHSKAKFCPECGKDVILPNKSANQQDDDLEAYEDLKQKLEFIKSLGKKCEKVDNYDEKMQLTRQYFGSEGLRLYTLARIAEPFTHPIQLFEAYLKHSSLDEQKSFLFPIILFEGIVSEAARPALKVFLNQSDANLQDKKALTEKFLAEVIYHREYMKHPSNNLEDINCFDIYTKKILLSKCIIAYCSVWGSSAIDELDYLTHSFRFEESEFYDLFFFKQILYDIESYAHGAEQYRRLAYKWDGIDEGNKERLLERAEYRSF